MIFRGFICVPYYYIICLQFTQIASNYPAFFNEEELHHVRRSVSQMENQSIPICDEDKLFEQLVNIRVTTPESIIMLSFLDGQSLCSKMMLSLGVLNNYMKTCRIPSTNLYVKLIKGVKKLDHFLCYDADYFQKFEMYYYCIHELEREFEICAGPLDWNEEHNHKKVCKTYRKLVDCYFIKVAEVCGLESAKSLKVLIVAVINEVINCPCDVSSDPPVKDVMPDMYIRKSIGDDLSNNVDKQFVLPSLFLFSFNLCNLYFYY